MSTLDLTADAHLQRLAATQDSGRDFLSRFSDRVDYRYMCLIVLANETGADVWTVTTFPGRDSYDIFEQAAADYIFTGGNTFTVTGGLATALSNAGYTVT